MRINSSTLHTSLLLAALIGSVVPGSSIANAASDPLKAQITILYDAFGKPSAMQKDWGYAALIEYSGKRILFDAGNDPNVLKRNAQAKNMDLAKLDFVVMSHRHGDHMGGLSYVLQVNPGVKIYAPKEGFGVYGSDLPGTFYRRDVSLPAEERYFGGAPPEVLRFGAAWPDAKFQLVDQNIEIAPGIHLITLISDKPGTLELRELSLCLDTPAGEVVVVGCSHPGIENILASVSGINPHIRLIAGGFHLVTVSDTEIEKVVVALHDKFRVDEIAPGHCTGEPAFAAFRRAFGERYRYAGLGTTLSFTDSGER